MARGDIGAIIYTKEWANAVIYTLASASVGGGIWMIGTRLPDGLYVVTVSVSAAGVITVVESQRYADFTLGSVGGFAHVSGNVWAVAYLKNDGAGLDGSFVGTFTCDPSGYLGAAFIDTFRLGAGTTNAIYAPDIINVSGNVFAAPYTESDNDGWVKTITINNNGFIDDAELDSWEFDTVFGKSVSIWHRSGTVYMITYGDAAPNGWLGTFNIQDDGTLPAVAGVGGWINRKAIGNQLQYRATVLPISGDVYANIWTGNDSDGFMRTIEITAAGAIGDLPIDSWEFELVNGHQAHGIVIDDNEAANGKIVCALHLALANVNAMHTFEISNTGTITKSFISEAVLDTDDRVSYLLIVDASGVAPNLYLIFYHYAADNHGWARTREIERAPVVPTVTTDPASGEAVESATLNGTLDHQGAAPSDCGFEWGETVAYGNTTPTEIKTTGETFSQIVGLNPDTTYHFRAFATNPAGTSYGADRTFATLVAVPTVSTDPASGMAVASATLSGTLDYQGIAACDCGFEWGPDTGYGTTTGIQTKGTGETFSQALGGLHPNTTYHFRAFATNSAGTSYGADRSFTTAPVTTRAYALARQEL